MLVVSLEPCALSKGLKLLDLTKNTLPVLPNSLTLSHLQACTLVGTLNYD